MVFQEDPQVLDLTGVGCLPLSLFLAPLPPHAHGPPAPTPVLPGLPLHP